MTDRPFESRPQPAVPFWNDPAKRGIVLQLGLATFLLFVIWTAWTNMLDNMSAGESHLRNRAF
jgi:flagellar biosynthesis/type III secretory pathway M-ring protein FliF/YscJ